jgi:hypothetical protein
VAKTTILPKGSEGLASLPIRVQIDEAVVEVQILTKEQVEKLSSNTPGKFINAFYCFLGIFAGLWSNLIASSLDPVGRAFVVTSLVLIGITCAVIGILGFIEWFKARTKKEEIKQTNSYTAKLGNLEQINVGEHENDGN